MFRLDNPGFACGDGGKHMSIGCFVCKSCSMGERIDRLHKVLSSGNIRELWHATVRLTMSDSGMDMTAPTSKTKQWSYAGVNTHLRPGSMRDLVAWYWKNRKQTKHAKTIKSLEKWGMNRKSVSKRVKMMKKGLATKFGVLSARIGKTQRLKGKSGSILRTWHRNAHAARSKLVLGRVKYAQLGRKWMKSPAFIAIGAKNASSSGTMPRFNAANLRKYQLHPLSPFELNVLKENGYKSQKALPWKLRPVSKKNGGGGDAKTAIQRSLVWSTAQINKRKKTNSVGGVLDITQGLGKTVSQVIGASDLVGFMGDSYLKHFIMLACAANTVPYYDYPLNSVKDAIIAGAHDKSLLTGNPTAIFDAFSVDPPPAKSLQVRLSWPRPGAQSSVVPLVGYPPGRSRVSLRSTYAYFFNVISRNHRNWPTWSSKRPIIMKPQWKASEVNEAKLRVARDEYVCLNDYFGKMVNRMMCKWPLRVTRKPKKKPKKPAVGPKKLTEHLKSFEKKMRTEFKLMSTGMKAKYEGTIDDMKKKMTKMRGKLSRLEGKRRQQLDLDEVQMRIHNASYETLSTMANLLTSSPLSSSVPSPAVAASSVVKHKPIPLAPTKPQTLKTKLRKLRKITTDSHASIAMKTMASLLIKKLRANAPAHKVKAMLVAADKGKKKKTTTAVSSSRFQQIQRNDKANAIDTVDSQLRAMRALIETEKRLMNKLEKRSPAKKVRTKITAIRAPKPRRATDGVKHKANVLHAVATAMKHSAHAKMQKLKDKVKDFKKHAQRKSSSSSPKLTDFLPGKKDTVNAQKMKKAPKLTDFLPNAAPKALNKVPPSSLPSSVENTRIDFAPSSSSSRKRKRRRRRRRRRRRFAGADRLARSGADQFLGKLRAEIEAKRRVAAAGSKVVGHQQHTVKQAAKAVSVANELLKLDRHVYAKQYDVLKSHEHARELASRLHHHPHGRHARHMRRHMHELADRTRDGAHMVTHAERGVESLMRKEEHTQKKLFDERSKSLALNVRLQHAKRVDAAVQRMLAAFGERELARKLTQIIDHPQSAQQHKHARAMLRQLRHNMMLTQATQKRSDALARLSETLKEQERSHVDQLKSIHKQREAINAAKLTNNLHILANSEHKHTLAAHTLKAQARLSNKIAVEKERESQMASRMAKTRQAHAMKLVGGAYEKASHVQHLERLMKKFRDFKPCCTKKQSPSTHSCAAAPNCLCTLKAKPNGCIQDAELPCPGPLCPTLQKL